jgi:FAD/FMN-containing dehydrogenase
VFDSLSCLPLQVRGGGGGTWGVATSATYKTYPVIRPSTFVAGGFNLTLARDDIQTIISKLASIAPDLSKLGFSGFFTMDSSNLEFIGTLAEGGLPKLRTGTTPALVTCTLS